LLKPVVEGVPEKLGEVVNYADNFFCLCRDESDANTVVKALRWMLFHHPAGSLKPNFIPQYEPGERFVFLGYGITPLKHGQLHFQPSQRNWEKHINRYRSFRRELCKPGRRRAKQRKMIERFWRNYKGWAHSFSHWDDRRKQMERMHSRLLKIAYFSDLEVELCI